MSEWISVKDRLPKKSGMYLVCHVDGRRKSAFWLSSKQIWRGCEAYSTLTNITYWMPIPEPPKMDEVIP